MVEGNRVLDRCETREFAYIPFPGFSSQKTAMSPNVLVYFTPFDNLTLRLDTYACSGFDANANACKNRAVYQGHLCAEHSCTIRSCAGPRANLSLYCHAHKCSLEQCPDIKLSAGGGQFPVGNSPFCASHTCRKAGCQELASPEQPYCGNHSCGQPGCARPHRDNLRAAPLPHWEAGHCDEHAGPFSRNMAGRYPPVGVGFIGGAAPSVYWVNTSANGNPLFPWGYGNMAAPQGVGYNGLGV